MTEMYYISYEYENIDGVRFAVDGEIIKVGVEYIILNDAVVTQVSPVGIKLNHVRGYELYESKEAALAEFNRVLKFIMIERKAIMKNLKKRRLNWRRN